MPSAIDVAYTLHVRGDLVAAEAAYRRMIERGEDPLDAANNLFLLLENQGRWDDLAELYRLIERWVPQRADWAITLGSRLLENGRYRAGWQWHEARRHQAETQSPSPPLSFPEWKGEPVERLLVWSEQGRGDEIMFARFLVPLAARGIDVTFMCRPELARAYRHLPVRVAGAVPGAKIPAQDKWVLVGTLPLRLGDDDVPAPAPITGDPASPQAGRIGVMSAGGPKIFGGVNRSLPPHAAEQLLALPGVVSLAPENTGARDFQDTADIIAGLDLVISVDTSVAHLAASMGKPTWVLLSSERSDWRWPRNAAVSPWYPAARLFRQPTPGDWDGVVAAVRAALAGER